MSTMPVRAAMVPVTRRMRAYFAPVDRASGAPSVFDPGKHGAFPLDAPPSPWIDLGWIDGLQRTYATPTEALRAGKRGAPVAQFRGTLDARVEFRFREWGKLQMALAGGAEHMNVLASDPSADAEPSGGTPLAAATLLSGSTANELMLGIGVVDGFAVGDLVAVDGDYAQQTGYVGTGIAAAYVSDPDDVNRDANYVRRVTFNVGRVVEKTATSLLLAQALLGGAPAAGMGVQKVVAFVDREGGSFFQEWSALFVAEEESGGRVCFYYPRLSPGAGSQREDAVAVVDPLGTLGLRAAFVAMPHTDENDGQSVLCYRSYFAAGMAGVY